MHVTEYPEFEGLQEWVGSLWEQSLAQYLENVGLQQAPFRADVEEVLVVGQWGAGSATKGIDPLRLVYVFDREPVSDADAEAVADVLSLADDHVRGGMEIVEGVSQSPPGPADEFFSDIEIPPQTDIEDAERYPVIEDNLLDFLTIEFTQQPGVDEAYSLTNEEQLKVEERTLLTGPTGNELTQEEAEQLIEDRGEIAVNESQIQDVIRTTKTPGPDPQDKEQVLPVFEEPEEEDESIEVGDISVQGQINEDEGTVEVPSGKKQSTKVEYRDLYDFEVEMIAMGDGGTELDIDEGIGLSMARGSFSFTEPAITFPRTGHYVKNRLFYEGEAYVRMLHKDLCRYSWGIIEEHGVMVRPGLYEHFRNTIFKLKEAGLIQPLGTQEATDRGLSVFPETPDGRQANFLEQRNWYELADGVSLDNPAWDDVNDFLYGEG